MEIDHLLAKRDDEGQPDKGSRNAGEDHQGHIEFGNGFQARFLAEDKQRGYREHDSRRGPVNSRGHRLVNVVFQDAGATHQSAKDPPAKNRGEFRSLDRKPKLQRCVTNGKGNQCPQAPADQYGRPCEFRIWAKPNRDVVEYFFFRHACFRV